MESSEVPPPLSRVPFVTSVGFMLSQLGYYTARRFAQVLGEVELEPRQFALLRAISWSEGLSQQALAATLQIPPSRMVALVDDLEQRGLVERRVNPADRRARALHLTEHGRSIFTQAARLAGAHEQRLCAGLSNEERQELLRLLNVVARTVELPVGVHPDLQRGE